MPQTATIPVQFLHDPVRGTDIVRVKIDRNTTREFPVDKLVVIEGVETTYREHYVKEWKAYEQGQDPIGTPIEMLPWIDPVIAQRLATKEFTSLERLAAISDEQLTTMRMPGIQKIRDRAVEELELRERGAQFDDLNRQLEEQRQESAAQAAELAELRAQLEAQSEAQKPPHPDPEAAAAEASPAEAPPGAATPPKKPAARKKRTGRASKAN
ncbi:MAG: hypothetical protein OXH38_11845 [Chloroflexi bacterium]|nr:hypothetical protein [Chloroflexota bacterium]